MFFVKVLYKSMTFWNRLSNLHHTLILVGMRGRTLHLVRMSGSNGSHGMMGSLPMDCSHNHLISNNQLNNKNKIHYENLPIQYIERGGSNAYPQSMFWSKNKKNRYTPANPSFAI